MGTKVVGCAGALFWGGIGFFAFSTVVVLLLLAYGRERKKGLAPLALVGVSALGLVGGLIWLYLGAPRRETISFQKIAIFWVNVDKDVYQIGVVLKFFNADSKSYLLKGLTFHGVGWSFFPRGSYYCRGLLQNEDKADVLEDNYIKPNDDAYFQKLLPIKFDLTVNGDDMPDFVLRGDWAALFGDEKLSLFPNRYAVMRRSISQREWDDLRKPQSTIDVESLHYKPIPPEPRKDEPDSYYLLYSRDRSATIDNPYFAQTQSAKGANGVLVFVGGLSCH